MTTSQRLRVAVNLLMAPGSVLMWRDGVPVWYGQLGQPVEDVECDKITLHPSDYDRVMEEYLRLKGFYPCRLR